MRLLPFIFAAALPAAAAAQQAVTPIPAPATAPRSAAPGRPSAADHLGGADATVVIEEYADFQCPFCAAHEMQYAAAVDRWVRGGQPEIRFEFYDLALPQHLFATAAARSARCARGQAAFAAVRHAIFAAQSDWLAAADPARRVEELVRGMLRDTVRFDHCLTGDSAAASATIAANLERARAAGVTGTPTFVIRVGARTAQIARPTPPDSMARIIWQLRASQP